MSDAALLDKFYRADTRERLNLISDDAAAAALRPQLGAEAVEQYRALARKTPARKPGQHLGVSSERNLVFVPGIMGSLLLSKQYGDVWWLPDPRNLKRVEDLRVGADGENDLKPEFEMSAFGIDCSYEGMIGALLRSEDFGHVLAPFDWRKPLSMCAAAFKKTVEATAAANSKKKVHVVAHSMGGLCVRTALMLHPALWASIEKIVFIATPHYGSPAIAGYLKNHFWGFELMALLGFYMSRECFRSMRGGMSMLPAPRGIYPGTRNGEAHPCANFDMYDAKAWNLKLAPADEAQLAATLKYVGETHAALYAAHRKLDQGLRDRMAVIAGVGYKTLFNLTIEPDWLRGEIVDTATSRKSNDVNREGDGRVPVASAALESVGELRYVKGEHGALPNIPAVYDDVMRFLRGEPMQLPTTMGGALGTHLGANTASETSALDRATPVAGDDPGYFSAALPDAQRLDELRQKVEAGELPKFARVKLL